MADLDQRRFPGSSSSGSGGGRSGEAALGVLPPEQGLEKTRWWLPSVIAAGKRGDVPAEFQTFDGLPNQLWIKTRTA
uniref:Uncharacterized protein n=1 Tax=Oryza sativa subsp. japonica TaxID=39947 RepID=Q6ZDG1_ORYSJ|nr:hypothetical protein [Oryza sativa Japonica Group]BAD09349.1 hypothetical protein [Oryza sativa Japonica Group]